MEHLKSILEKVYNSNDLSALKNLSENDIITIGKTYEDFVSKSVINIDVQGIVSKDIFKRVVFEALYSAFSIPYDVSKIQVLLADFIYDYLITPYYINETTLLFRTFLTTQLSNFYKTNIFAISHNSFVIIPVSDINAVINNLFNLLHISILEETFRIIVSKPIQEEALFNIYKQEGINFFKRFRYEPYKLLINTDDVNLTNQTEENIIENEFLLLLLEDLKNEYNKV